MLLRRELVVVGLEAPTAKEALLGMAQRFVDAGLVKPSYPQAVCDRELVFATGIARSEIAGAPFDVAIPHADGTHVIESGVGVATLASQVDFRSMHGGEALVHPRMLFMLAIAKPAQEIAVLQRITRLLQTEGLLERCAACTDTEELHALLAEPIGS